MRDSMVFYRGFYEAIKDLPDEEFAECVRAILAYALDGEDTDPTGVARVAFMMAKPQIDKNNIRYQNSKNGGRPKANDNRIENETKPNQNQTETKTKPNSAKGKPNVNVNVNVNDNANENVNDNANVNVNENQKESTLTGTKEKRFKPPTVEEVREYCLENNYNIDAQRFVDFYESKGWMVGKNKMKNWKAAVGTWTRNQNPRGDPTNVFDEWRRA